METENDNLDSIVSRAYSVTYKHKRKYQTLKNDVYSYFKNFKIMFHINLGKKCGIKRASKLQSCLKPKNREKTKKLKISTKFK